MDQKLRKGQLGRIDVQTTAARKRTAHRNIDEKINEKRWKNLHHYKLLNVHRKQQALMVVEVHALNLRCEKNWKASVKIVTYMINLQLYLIVIVLAAEQL